MIVNGHPVAWIDDMSVTTTVLGEVAQIVSRGGDRVLRYCQTRPACARTFRIFKADVPRGFAGWFTVHTHVLTKINEHVLDASLQRQCHDTIHRVFFADAAEVNAHILARQKNPTGAELDFVPPAQFARGGNL